VNPPSTELSKAYERFETPIENGERGGFDVHIYYYQENAEQRQYARELWERIRRECKAPSCPQAITDADSSL
jgi:Dopa 4,5-dioxygenase family